MSSSLEMSLTSSRKNSLSLDSLSLYCSQWRWRHTEARSPGTRAARSRCAPWSAVTNWLSAAARAVAYSTGSRAPWDWRARRRSGALSSLWSGRSSCGAPCGTICASVRRGSWARRDPSRPRASLPPERFWTADALWATCSGCHIFPSWRDIPQKLRMAIQKCLHVGKIKSCHVGTATAKVLWSRLQ